MKIFSRENIQRLVKSHHNALFVQLDFIHTEQNENTSNFSVKLHFVFQLCAITLALIIGIFGLYRECDSSNTVLNVDNLLKNDCIFVNQIFPRQTRKTMSVVMIIVGTNVVLNAVASIYTGTLDRRFRMICVWKNRQKLIQINGKDLSIEESTAILLFHQKAKLACKRLTVLFCFAVLGYYYAMILYNSGYKISILSFTYWLGIFPILALTIVYEIFAKIMFVFMNSEYIWMRQRSILSELTKMNQHLRAIYPTEKVSLLKYNFIWQKYRQLNLKLMSVCRDLHAYAIFWSPYLTLIFLHNTTYEAYMLYGMLLEDENPILMKAVFGYFLSAIGLFFYFTIRQCAKVVQANQAIWRQNRAFYFEFQRLEHSNQTIKTRNLLKAESLLVPRAMHRYAFHLYGNYRITTKSFHVIFSYVAVLFLWVIKSRRQQNTINSAF